MLVVPLRDGAGGRNCNDSAILRASSPFRDSSFSASDSDLERSDERVGGPCEGRAGRAVAVNSVKHPAQMCCCCVEAE